MKFRTKHLLVLMVALSVAFALSSLWGHFDATMFFVTTPVALLVGWRTLALASDGMKLILSLMLTLFCGAIPHQLMVPYPVPGRIVHAIAISGALWVIVALATPYKPSTSRTPK